MLTSTLKSISNEAQEIVTSLVAKIGPLPCKVSLAGFVKAFSTVTSADSYSYVPYAAQQDFRQLKSILGAEVARNFLRAALGYGISQLISSGKLEPLPPRIQSHQTKQLQRIVRGIGSDTGWFDLENDLFLKDFGLVTLRLYAAASSLLDIRCGIARSIVFREGFLFIPKNAAKLYRLGGFKPYIQTHTHLSYLDEFNEEGRNECYRCCVDLYRINPMLLGMFGSSWFYDPQLAEISPHLAYLREVPMSGGAELFFVEKGNSAIRNALATSNHRRLLYENGKYIPTNYMIAWRKKDQIAWAERHRSS